MATWRETFRKFQKALPSNATPKERAAATKAAARAYRGQHRSKRSNPGGRGIVNLAIMGGLGYVGYQWYKGQQAPAPAPTDPVEETSALSI